MVERTSLSDEIIFNQYGQDVCSDQDLLEPFNQLDEEHKRIRVLQLLSLIKQLSFTEAEAKQIFTDRKPLLESNALPSIMLYANQLSKGQRISLVEDELEHTYMLLMKLFKLVYQRCYNQKKDSPANWWFWDLSNPEIVQSIPIRHKELVEQVYNDPSFRSEFACIAKLWNDRKVAWTDPEPTADQKDQFTFISYDQITERLISATHDKTIYAIGLLMNALNKALSKKYGMETELVRRLVFDVIERHLGTPAT